jgi:hypothetical protein
VRRLLLLVASVLALAGCRLDLVVSVAMEPDGTGVVTVVATADQDLLERAPGVLDDLRFDDAVAQGWQVGEPVTGDDGSVTLTITHDFHTDVELANVLNSIGPPFAGSPPWQAARTPGVGENEGHVSNAVIGTLQLENGFDSFSDSDLTAAVGGLPFGEQIAASGLTPDQAMSLTFRVDLPGEVVLAPTGTEVSPGVLEWRPPLDGTATTVEYQTVQRPASEGNSWAGPLSTVALLALIAWVAVSVAFITFVVIARRSKRRKRERALRHLR